VDRTERLTFRLPSIRLGFDSVKTRINQKWSSEKIRKLQEALLAWYRRHKRVLPWRSDPTPYHVWTAEIMLQQTRVRTALPYYDRFLRRFPDVEALAAASEEDVLEFWAGLGYYQRARNLRNAARKIVLARQQAVDYIPGAWGLPVRILRTARQRSAAAQSLAREILGSSPELHACDDVRHAITYRRLLAHVYRAAVEPSQPRLAGDGRFVWFPRARVNRLLTSSLFRKGLAASVR
jgi:adenine-specific DNA glycosylase